MKKKRKKSLPRIILKYLLRLFALIIVLLAIVAGVAYIKFSPKLNEYMTEAKRVVDESTPESFSSELGGRIFYSNGKIMAYLKSGKSLSYIRFDNIPQDVIDAFVAVEDKRFYEHNGIDRLGIARVLFNYVRSRGKKLAGASTITQQLARNIFLTHEVSISRKAKEALIALNLEKKYSKKQILEFYINNIYFANGFYGIGAAAKGYFDKDISKLSLSQIAFLAAIPNNPSHYDPIEHKENTMLRRDKFLRDMHEQGYITDKEFNKAIKEKIKLKQSKSILNDYETTYAMECAIRYLMSNQGFKERTYFNSKKDYKQYQESYEEAYNQCRQRLYIEGYDIYTSIDKSIQKSLQNKIDDTLSFSKEKKGNKVYSFQGAATCIDNKTGYVVAIVGGRAQSLGGLTYNRAFQAHRQPGSAIKPLVVYTPAIENGYVKNTVVEDKKMKDGPKNAGNVYSGAITLQMAVEKSKNVVAWTLMEELTPPVGLSYIQEMLFRKIVHSDYINAAALGGLTYGATTEEMAGGYATLANNGVFREPTCLVAIKKDEEDMYTAPPVKRIFSRAASQEMTEILQGVLKRGTAAKLGFRNPAVEAAGKTGTTNESKDGWFCGYTPYYTLAVWVGYDVPRNVQGLWGASYPGYIWKAMMEELVANKPPAKFDISDIGGEKNPTAISKYALEHTSVIINVDNSDEKKVGIVADCINRLENMNVSDALNAAKIYNKAYAVLKDIKDEEMKSEYEEALTEAYSRFKAGSSSDDAVNENGTKEENTANTNNNGKNTDKTDNKADISVPNETDNTENNGNEIKSGDEADTDPTMPAGTPNNEGSNKQGGGQDSSMSDKYIEVGDNEQLLVPIEP